MKKKRKDDYLMTEGKRIKMQSIKPGKKEIDTEAQIS